MTTTDSPWQRLARSNANASDVLSERLAPRPGERVFDVGTLLHGRRT